MLPLCCIRRIGALQRFWHALPVPCCSRPLLSQIDYGMSHVVPY